MNEAGPAGELALLTVAMPAGTNPSGDICGGWLLAQMDLAAGALGMARAQGRVATVALDAVAFHRPVRVGDTVGYYGEIVEVRRTSFKIRVETWVRRKLSREHVEVTEGVFTVVARDGEGRPRAVPQSR